MAFGGLGESSPDNGTAGTRFIASLRIAGGVTVNVYGAVGRRDSSNPRNAHLRPCARDPFSVEPAASGGPDKSSPCGIFAGI
jgi:hypothetical protein